MSETVFLKDVLSDMATLDKNGRAKPFSISYRTLNRNSKTGGKLVEIDRAKLCMREEFQNHSPSTELLRYAKPQKPKLKKNPNHWDNKTRNIKTIPEGKIRKIHINHIISFNSKKVVY